MNQKKGSLQRKTSGKFKGSTKFPFYKRNVLSNKQQVSPPTNPPRNSSIKPVSTTTKPHHHSRTKTILKHLTQNVSMKPSRTSTFSYFTKKPKQDENLLTMMRIIKYMCVVILVLSIITNFLYLWLYIYDYFQSDNSVEKNQLKDILFRTILLLLGSVTLLIIANSYWQVFDSFSIPLSVRLR